MELPRRCKEDMFLPDGAFRSSLARLRQRSDAHGLRIAIVAAFDQRTHMLPYWWVDRRMAPCSARALADVLDAAGFSHLRVVLQQWTPNFKPSMARLDGCKLDLLLISAMQVHAEPAYDLVRDAHRLGSDRPLILVGGPKAIYEPTDYFELGPDPGVGADCAVTGEAYVLLELLETLLAQPGAAASPLRAFEQARRDGTLHSIPGLVYLSHEAPLDRPVAVNTGVQRLLRDFDELPMPDACYRLLEPPHRGRGLKPEPLPARKVRRHSPIASILATQGCRFRCPYCSIPAANQRQWRHKSAERFAAEIKHIYENFGIRDFFGTDDNFFNERETVVELMSAMARTTTGGAPLGRRIKFYTEATQLDVLKHRDLLPLCREGGLRGLWFGIEDLTGELVQKGQSAKTTTQTFNLLLETGIEPHVMLIHSDAQPLRSPRGVLSGLLNQTQFVFDAGAVTYQCTYLGPAVGSRDLEPAMKSHAIFRRVGGELVPQAYQDGNHVAASRHPRPWEKQLNLTRAYMRFYNPINTVRAALGLRQGSVGVHRLAFQILGQIGLLLTIPRHLHWARRLRRGPIERWEGLQHARIPMVDAHTGIEMNWAIQNTPAADLPRVTAAGSADGTFEPALSLPTAAAPAFCARAAPATP